jgi:hypothetical protein
LLLASSADGDTIGDPSSPVSSEQISRPTLLLPGSNGPGMIHPPFAYLGRIPRSGQFADDVAAHMKHTIAHRELQGSRARPLQAGAAVALLALVVAACTTDQTAAAQIGISPEAFTKIVEGEEDFLSPVSERRVEAWIGYVDGDTVVRIRNGGTVPFGSMELQFYVNPFPPTRFDVEVELAVVDSDGNPADVQMEAWYDMVFMTHGQPIAEVQPVGVGRFSRPLDLFMFGPWVLKTTIRSSTGEGDLPLIIYVWPNV